ncbi:MAG: hypothetical protein IPL46_30715 [Saprospiraceae bacterium]|nr:hypothetical protein [Saprospiraceae bacterium]
MSLLLALILTIAMLALSRAGFGLQQAITPRYQIIAILFIVILYGVGLDSFKENVFVHHTYFLIFGLVLFLTRFDDQLDELRDRRQKLESGLYSYYSVEKDHLSYPDSARANRILRVALSNNIYDHKGAFDNLVHEKREQMPEVSDDINYRIDGFYDNSEVLTIIGWAFLSESNAKKVKTQIVLRSGEASWIFPTVRVNRIDVDEKYGDRKSQLEGSGFNLSLYKPLLDIPDGTYDLAILLESNRVSKWIPIDRKTALIRPLTVPNQEPRNLVIGIEPLYHIDEVNIVEDQSRLFGSVPLLIDSDTLVLRGWAVDVINQSLPRRVIINVGDERFAAVIGLSRPDVAMVMKQDAYLNSGFKAVIPTSGLKTGIKNVFLEIDTEFDAYYLTDSFRILIPK